MIIVFHIAFNLIVFFLMKQIIHVNYFDLILLFASNLMDLDHLFSKLVYHPKRNPFKAHFLHKNWIIILIISISILFVRPLTFLGIGILSHLILDYFYIKKNKL